MILIINIVTFIYHYTTKKGKTIVVRYPTSEDLRTMTDYMNMISREQTFIRFQGEQLTLDEEKKYLQEMVEKIEMSQAVKLLAFHNNKLVGISDIVLQDKTSAHVGVFGLTVAVGYREEGIGTLLMKLVVEEGKKHMPKLKIIQLGVFSNNPIACKMYERFGFIKYGTLPRGIFHRNQYIDHILMYKNV